MKHIILIALCLSGFAAYGQSTTNTLRVVVTAEQEATLRLSWRLDNFERTNAVPALPAITFRDWQEEICAAALVQRANDLKAQREARLLEAFRTSDENKQLEIYRTASVTNAAGLRSPPR